MTQKDKELLLKDLCARLLYGVKVTWDGKHSLIVTPHIYCAIISEDNINNLPKLLLRPMSSMTEEEKEELNNYIFSEKGLRYFWFDDGIMYSGPDNQCFIGLGNDTIDKMIDWLNKHHFDYRGLIERGLALEAPEDMYELKEK